MIKKIVVLALMVSALAALSGCNTARGFGEDVQHLGGAISRVASYLIKSGDVFSLTADFLSTLKRHYF